MLWVLVKKQLAEVFRSYFYDMKKNRMRSKGAIIGWFIFFFVIMVGMLGGMFTGLSFVLCAPLSEVGLGWMYFLIMSGLAVVLGAFGSVFNTYSGLYLPKDNDLLLSLPIPIGTIIASRLINVYLLGTMYAATVLLPTLFVYWIAVGASVSNVLCGILLFVIVTTFVLILSCLLGWVVAKVSLKLKNKSFITVLIAVVGIAAYYFIYFKAQDYLKELIANAQTYGASIKGAAYGLYLFGRIGEGDWLATAIFTAGTAVLFALVWLLLSRSFLSIAAAGGKTQRIRYTEKRAREKSPFGALFGKELGRFASSANYMLNCGLGTLLLIAAAVFLMIKGHALGAALDEVFAVLPDMTAILLCAVLCLVAAMNDMAAPSVSLEGKSIWIPQSLPVSLQDVLRAKAAAQLLVTGVPMLIASVTAAIVLDASPAVRVMTAIMPLSYVAFSSVFATVIGVRIPILNWTSELAPIKQSGAVAIVMFGGWGIAVTFGVPYLLLGPLLGAAIYLLLWTVLFTAAALLLLRWLDTRGAARFAAL